jgi:hypothetical protein
VIPNWNTYEDLTTMALVEAKAHLNSKFVWLVRMREHFTHLIKRFKSDAIEEGRLDYFNTKRNTLTKYISRRNKDNDIS